MNQTHRPGCRCKACVDHHLSMGLAEAVAHINAFKASLPDPKAARAARDLRIAKALFPGCTP